MAKAIRYDSTTVNGDGSYTIRWTMGNTPLAARPENGHVDDGIPPFHTSTYSSLAILKEAAQSAMDEVLGNPATMLAIVLMMLKGRRPSMDVFTAIEGRTLTFDPTSLTPFVIA